MQASERGRERAGMERASTRERACGGRRKKSLRLAFSSSEHASSLWAHAPTFSRARHAHSRRRRCRRARIGRSGSERERVRKKAHNDGHVNLRSSFPRQLDLLSTFSLLPPPLPPKKKTPQPIAAPRSPRSTRPRSSTSSSPPRARTGCTTSPRWSSDARCCRSRRAGAPRTAATARRARTTRTST